MKCVVLTSCEVSVLSCVETVKYREGTVGRIRDGSGDIVFGDTLWGGEREGERRGRGRRGYEKERGGLRIGNE